MTREEAYKELRAEGHNDMNACFLLPERLARREAEARVKELEAERDRWYNAAQSMAEADFWIAEREAGLVRDDEHDHFIFKEVRDDIR